MNNKVKCNMMSGCETPVCVTQRADAIKLVNMILNWWEDAQYTTIPCGDGDWDNLFDEEPNFVTKAKLINKEVI